LAALAENKLRLGLLFVDEEPAAAQLWFLQVTESHNEHPQKTASIFKLAYISITNQSAGFQWELKPL